MKLILTFIQLQQSISNRELNENKFDFSSHSTITDVIRCITNNNQSDDEKQEHVYVTIFIIKTVSMINIQIR